MERMTPFIFRSIKRSNEYDGITYDFIKLPYWTVKVEIGNALEKQDMKAAVEAVVKREVEVDHHMTSFGVWLVDNYNGIIEMESKALAGTPDPKLIAAGLNNLNIFGEMNTIDMLAGEDILKYDLIKQLPYEEVFNKLLMIKMKNEINKEYQEKLRS